MSQVSTDIAADVSKDELVVATHGQEPIACLAQSAGGDPTLAEKTASKTSHWHGGN